MSRLLFSTAFCKESSVKPGFTRITFLFEYGSITYVNKSFITDNSLD